MNDDLIFDYKKEGLLFIQNKVFKELYEPNAVSGLASQIEELDEKANLITETTVEIENVDDTSELLLPKLKYAIRNDDIKLLDAIIDGLKAAASVNYFRSSPSDKTVAAITGVIAALVKLGRDLLKGVRLSSTELLILVILKADGAIEINDLREKLSNKNIDIEEKELLSIIGNLSQKKSLIGTNVSLVAKTTDGRWVTTI